MRCAQVVAVESEGSAVEAGRRTACYHKLGNLRFEALRVEEFLANQHEARPDALIVNPPRSGLAGVAASVAQLRAKRMTYVSCNPTTLARDVKTLLAGGYRLQRVTPVDLFPHTFHVEVVCDMELT